MTNGVEITETSDEHEIAIDPVGFIAEIINNIGDQRDIIRELISNAASKEVSATKVEIKVYESDLGLAVTVSDDGIGMNYTKDNKKPGRLDKFLNAAQGEQAGFKSDEFGAKGLGAKLLYDSSRVEIETWDGGEKSYRIVLDQPYENIIEKKLAVPTVFTTTVKKNIVKKGTTITVKGLARVKTITKNFKLDHLEKYLRYYTVIGYTKTETRSTPLPEFILSVGGISKSIKPGFPFITSENKTEDTKIATFGPIEIQNTTQTGKTVRVLLKGAITTETGKFQLTEETGGVWLSVKGIPYFKLPTNSYARKLMLTDDFIRFVVECDDVSLNMSRSDFSYDERYDAFEDALNDAFGKIKEDPTFQKFYQNRRRELMVEMQSVMNQKKEEFSSEDKKYVWYKGKMVLAEPESEYDTAALLWILEGQGGLPFAKFKTLQYPGYREGIDMLVNYQEEEDKEEHICTYAEIEKMFSSLIKHKHSIGQMSLAFCWKMDKDRINLGKIAATKKPYKHIYSFGDTNIPVFEINQFPGIFVGNKKEAKEHNQTQADITT